MGLAHVEAALAAFEAAFAGFFAEEAAAEGCEAIHIQSARVLPTSRVIAVLNCHALQSLNAGGCDGVKHGKQRGPTKQPNTPDPSSASRRPAEGGLVGIALEGLAGNIAVAEEVGSLVVAVGSLAVGGSRLRN